MEFTLFPTVFILLPVLASAWRGPAVASGVVASPAALEDVLCVVVAVAAAVSSLDSEGT